MEKKFARKMVRSVTKNIGSTKNNLNVIFYNNKFKKRDDTYFLEYFNFEKTMYVFS